MTTLPPFTMLTTIGSSIETALVDIWENSDTPLDFEDWVPQITEIDLDFNHVPGVAHAIAAGWWTFLYIDCDRNWTQFSCEVYSRMTIEGYCRPGCVCEMCQMIRESEGAHNG